MFVHGKPFQPSLLFVGKAKSLPYGGAPERFFNRVGSCFTKRHYIRLERLLMDKHSSLLRTFVNYGRKFFITLEPVIKIDQPFGVSPILLLSNFSTDSILHQCNGRTGGLLTLVPMLLNVSLPR